MTNYREMVAQAVAEGQRKLEEAKAQAVLDAAEMERKAEENMRYIRDEYRADAIWWLDNRFLKKVTEAVMENKDFVYYQDEGMEKSGSTSSCGRVQYDMCQEQAEARGLRCLLEEHSVPECKDPDCSYDAYSMYSLKIFFA
jgi:hypothetical protein